MSKKNRRQSSAPVSAPTASNDLTVEYRIIKWDLVRVLILNLVFLAAVLALYYTNKNSGFLEHWSDRFLNF